MSRLHKLKEWATEIDTGLYVQYDIAEAAKPTETEAALRIQKHWRGFKIRLELERCTAAATHVQSHYRGVVGRRRFGNIQREVAAKERQEFFTGAALVVQRVLVEKGPCCKKRGLAAGQDRIDCPFVADLQRAKWMWRGYRVRKYTHSFYAQKAYIKAVLATNQAVADSVAEEQQALAQFRALQAQEERRAKFRQDCTGRHHLASTYSVAGVFNSPYAPFMGGLPMFEGVPVEEHLEAVARADGRARTKSRGAQAYSQTGLSLQAQSPYYAKDDERRSEAVHHNIMNLGDRAFVSTVRHKPDGETGLDTHGGTCRIGTPYDLPVMRATGPAATLPGQVTHPAAFFTSVKKKTLFEDNLVKTQKVVS